MEDKNVHLIFFFNLWIFSCVIYTGVPLVFWMPEMHVCLQKDIEKYFPVYCRCVNTGKSCFKHIGDATMFTELYFAGKTYQGPDAF